MKKNKGFTLVELLAVIAILAILVIIALPNVMGMFKTAKKNSFTTEVKKIAQTAEQQWMIDSMVTTSEKVYARCSEGCGPGLDLSGRTELDYYVKLNKGGKIVRLYATDGTYQYEYNGEELSVEEIDGTQEVQDLEQANVITIDNNTVKKGGTPIVTGEATPGGSGGSTEPSITYDSEYDDYDDSSASSSYVARIKTTYYTSLQSAINAAVANDTIYVIKNVSGNVTNNKTIKINFKNHTLSGSITNQTGGNLLLVSGIIQKNGTPITNNADLTIGIKDDNNSGVNIKNTNTGDLKISVIENNSNLTFNKGDISANSTNSAGNIYGINTGDDGRVIFNGGTVNVTSNFSSSGIYARKELILNGGTINVTSKHDGTGAYSGTKITINGGTINVKANTSANANGYSRGVLFRGTKDDTIEVNGGKVSVTATSGYTVGIDMYSGGTAIINNGEIYSSTSGSTYNTSYGIECRANSSVILNGGYVTAVAPSSGEANSIYTPYNTTVNGGYIRASAGSSSTYGIRKGSNSRPITVPDGKELVKGYNGGYTAWYLRDK